ncbi:MAG: winged helix-turn-helix domain-containing protein [Anaerolineae bacterium]|nr:winged helix-turn-helix domain-containing protein [Anaerolineae bacterium]
MTPPGKRQRSYLEVLADILMACPDTRTALYFRSGATWARFHSPKYLPMLLSQGLIRRETENAQIYTVQRGVDAYILTPKGERYLKLIAEAKKLLGIGD